MRTFAFALVALLSPGLAAAQAAIQSYPAKTIRIIVPWARRIFHIGAAQLIQKVRLEAALHNAPGLDVSNNTYFAVTAASRTAPRVRQSVLFGTMPSKEASSA